jgi:hypothetical protein
MAHRLEQADKILALELLDGVAYSEEYRRRVQSALPPGAVTSERFWFELDATIDIFLLGERRRLQRPPVVERKHWQRIDSLAAALIKNLLKAHRQTPRTCPSVSNPGTYAVGFDYGSYIFGCGYAPGSIVLMGIWLP